MPTRRCFTVLFALAFLTAGSVFAHSFERSFASARYVKRLDSEGLHVLVVVEMPTLDVLGDFRRFLRDHPEASDEENTEAFRLQQLEALSSSFFLTVGGEALDEPWTPVDSPANGLGDADFFVYMIEHRRPAPRGRQVTVQLRNRLQPAKVVFMSNRSEAGDAWRVEADSSTEILADGLDGEVVGPDVGEEAQAKWSTDESMRELRVVFSRSSSSR